MPRGAWSPVNTGTEGGEYDIFTADSDWLECCGDIAMEVHPWGNRETLANTIRAKGFEVITTDQHNRPCQASHAEYLYASSRGNLIA